MRRAPLWVAALLPLAAGVVLAVLGRAGRLPGGRLFLSALPGDWALAAGAALSLLAVVGLGAAALRDRTWRRRLAERVAEAGQDRRLLLSRLDHELKNPLTAMRAATANLAAVADPAQDAAVGTIEEQVLRLSRLTTDLRKIADIESARIDRRPVDLTDLIEEMVDVARDLPGAAERQISVDLPRAPWPLPPVPGDADLLSLAVANLLDNALKYTPPGGRVEVRAREAAGEVVVEVADTGQGIPPDELPQVWEEMYRSPSARAVPGSGLGLPLVRAVVERHGGSVHADSRVGSGTLVRLALPSARHQA
ncbi:sensor histidine kinase [Klenkia brasiliensis]|uniref:Sensor-like histidine kinase SenX3 n=1 Tax=Klenkia brasiliensis TaxID=333142 RepID=A0A1G7PIM3_9ACTN|nr:HAMP domain-containing sensor histidine kinase [Klenkia brasiliensis]SDF85240.1 His Kinase A (phospho-acceptor) domain-containing protein [Klenkia brasiliensis]